MHKSLCCLLTTFLLFFCSTYSWSAELILVGDWRQTSGNEDHVLAGKIINDAIQYVQDNSQPPSELQGIILSGDYVSSGKDPNGWATLRSAYSAAFVQPLYPCLGNHDTEAFDLAYKCWNYYDTFQKPRWYSADIGNVHLDPLTRICHGIHFHQNCCLILCSITG